MYWLNHNTVHDSNPRFSFDRKFDLNATQVFEKSVSSTENNPAQEYTHPDDQTTRSD